MNIYTKQIESWPEEINGWWGHVTFFDHHPNLGGMCQWYYNNKNISGTFTYSNKLMTEYPDGYGTWFKPDEKNEVYGNRIYMRKDLRGNKFGPILMTQIFQFLEYMGFISNLGPTKSQAGYQLWTDAFGTKYGDKLEVLNRDDNDFGLREEFFEQPVHPSIFFYKRKVVIDE